MFRASEWAVEDGDELTMGVRVQYDVTTCFGVRVLIMVVDCFLRFHPSCTNYLRAGIRHPIPTHPRLKLSSFILKRPRAHHSRRAVVVQWKHAPNIELYRYGLSADLQYALRSPSKLVRILSFIQESPLHTRNSIKPMILNYSYSKSS